MPPPCLKFNVSIKYSDGTCVRDYLHIVDLARGHTRALEVLADDSTIFNNCPTKAHFKAYNLGKGKGMSVLQIVEAMRKATGFDYKYEFVPRRYVLLHEPYRRNRQTH